MQQRFCIHDDARIARTFSMVWHGPMDYLACVAEHPGAIIYQLSPVAELRRKLHMRALWQRIFVDEYVLPIATLGHGKVHVLKKWLSDMTLFQPLNYAGHEYSTEAVELAESDWLKRVQVCVPFI